jgi:hypothetical protein
VSGEESALTFSAAVTVSAAIRRDAPSRGGVGAAFGDVSSGAALACPAGWDETLSTELAGAAAIAFIASLRSGWLCSVFGLPNASGFLELHALMNRRANIPKRNGAPLKSNRLTPSTKLRTSGTLTLLS